MLLSGSRQLPLVVSLQRLPWPMDKNVIVLCAVLLYQRGTISKPLILLLFPPFSFSFFLQIWLGLIILLSEPGKVAIKQEASAVQLPNFFTSPPCSSHQRHTKQSKWTQSIIFTYTGYVHSKVRIDSS